jgi:hypothetical protein
VLARGHLGAGSPAILQRRAMVDARRSFRAVVAPRWKAQEVSRNQGTAKVAVTSYGEGSRPILGRPPPVAGTPPRHAAAQMK